MKLMKKLAMIMVLCFSVVFLASCGQNTENESTETQGTETKQEETKTTGEKQTVNIFAAVSLTDALEEIKADYDAKNNTDLVFNLGGSGTLRQQIEEGAACDLFISAAENHMNTLEEAGTLTADSKVDLLTNVLVLVGKAELSGQEGKDVKAILTDASIESFAVGEPETVPAGKYTEQSLEKLGILEEVKSKINYAKDVRQVLDYVDTGNSDVGAVYKSDALQLKTGKVLAEFPGDSHDPIIYPMGLIKDSANQEAGKKFAEYLQTDEAKAIFEKHGFSIAK